MLSIKKSNGFSGYKQQVLRINQEQFEMKIGGNSPSIRHQVINFPAGVAITSLGEQGAFNVTAYPLP